MHGASGLGKSTMLASILEEHGFSETSSDPTKKYYKITGKDQASMDLITKAAKDGSVLIIDEWNVFGVDNVKHNFEAFLNNLLDSQGSELHPGFRIFASQNAAADLGRATSSRADTNRTHFVFYDDYSKEELIEIAATKLPHSEATEIC